MTNITIIPIDESHIQSFYEALDIVSRERKYLLFMQAPPFADVKNFVKNLINRNMVQVVALDNEKVIGWCDIVTQEFAGMQHNGHLGMGVLPAYRRNGIGEKLLNNAIQLAVNRKIFRIELEVFDSNKPAINLYKKNGFTTEGRKRNARFLDGKFDDIILMAKLFEQKELL